MEIWILFPNLWRFIRKWTNPNICHEVTDGPFCAQIYQGCTFDSKKENPYWHLNWILLKCWGDSWESGQIQIIAMQWLMAPSPHKYVCLILKRKFHTGPGQLSARQGRLACIISHIGRQFATSKLTKNEWKLTPAYCHRTKANIMQKNFNSSMNQQFWGKLARVS